MAAALHTCDGCGRLGEWDELWTWYGSHLDEEAGCVLEVCSLACVGRLLDTYRSAERALEAKRSGRLTRGPVGG